MFYAVEEEKKSKYDTFLSGTLLDKDLELVPDVFNKGKSLISDYGDGLKIVIDKKLSEPGILPDKVFTKVHITIPLLVFSDRATELFKLYSNKIEFFKITIENEENVVTGFQAANFLEKIDCADYLNSTITFETYDDNDNGIGNIYTIDGLVLDYSKLPEDINIFLLGNYEEPILLISEELKKKVEEANFEGFIFQSLKEFSI